MQRRSWPRHGNAAEAQPGRVCPGERRSWFLHSALSSLFPRYPFSAAGFCPRGANEMHGSLSAPLVLCCNAFWPTPPNEVVLL